ncbi:MAG TPA: DUF411 domain-containing protein [Gemmatimonadaceae bacterium]|nr:DUF411 domain-containing protein [Gemmatimonadaceae bacterium]
MTYSRRSFIKAAATSAAGILVVPSLAAACSSPAAAQTPITVYKTPTCGCCKEWVTHISANGFTPRSHDLQDLTETKDSLGVPDALRSCHTAVIGRYVIEGHVPADLIQKLVKEKPANILGLAVPGMPAGSPGMEVPGRKDPYDVIAFTRDGKRTVYARR